MGESWRARVRWAVVVLATLLVMVAWGRLLIVGATQPSRWRETRVTLADGQVVAPGLFQCRLNAFQRDGLIYRSCDRDRLGYYVVVVDPARGSAVASAPFPPSFLPPTWFAAVAADPAGGLTLLGEDEAGAARLRDDGVVEVLPPPPSAGIVYGFGWQGGRLGHVSARFEQGVSGAVQLATYDPGAGWSAPAPLPAPACGDAMVCVPLVAMPTAGGWQTYYARAPRQPADPAQIAAEILLVGADGATRATQTVTLTAASRAYRVEAGQLRWSSRFADRSGGNVLNYGGYTVLRRLADGQFSSLPTPPDDLFADAGERPPSRKPDLSSLTASYRIADGRLIWQPLYNGGGFAGALERASLLDDRWVALRTSARGMHLEERPLDPPATTPPGTVTARGPLFLGRQDGLLDLSDFVAPLLPAEGGGYWLLGRANEIIRIGADLRRVDGYGPLERFGHLFADFGGALDDKFHREAIWPKRAALGWVLFGWPPLALLAWARGRRAREAWAALLYLVLGLAALPWFWMASAYV